MYAIIEDGGRQFKVEPGKLIMIDFREKMTPGEVIEFGKVLALCGEESVTIGQPVVEGAKVLGEILKDAQGPKLAIGKFRRRKNSKRKTGHRQIYSLVKINEIVPG